MIVDSLATFEAQHVFIRGYGLDMGPRPVPEVVAVIAWLKTLIPKR